MADTKTYTTNYNLEKPGQDDFYDVAIFNANADKIDTEVKAAADRDTAHKNAPVLDHPVGSVTDAHIGNRTINQALASPGNTGTLTQLLSWITGRLKAMTGKTNWYDAPATTLEAANTHITATSGAHGATNANTANAIVQRDASGNFSAGTITAALNGNAATAATAVNATGSITGTISSTTQANFQGSQTTGIGTATGNLGGIMVQGAGGSAAAFASFHRPGTYASYFGLDTDNQWAVGGWSAGATRRLLAFQDQIPTSLPANGGTAAYANSAGNADTVDGYHASQLLDGFDGGHSFAANGYQKLSNGLIIQWGSVIESESATDYKTFPIAFPNAAFVCLLQLTDQTPGGLGASYGHIVKIVDKTKFLWTVAGTFSGGAYGHYIAIGY